MRLAKIKLKNYRCYQSETEFILDELTCIIGKNDIGKSTVLESLDAFFNDKIDVGDLSTDSDTNSIEITCYFEKIPDQIILDTSVRTSPKEEGILNKEDQLEIRKVFTFGARISKSIFLIAYHPSDDRIKNLLSLKNASLKSLAEELKIDLSYINKSKNPPIREAIRKYIGGDKTIHELKVDGNIGSEDNLKAIWSSLKNWLPVFSLFKVDKSLDDKDADVQDPMKIAIQEALSIPEIIEQLTIIEQKVKEKSTEVADRTIAKLKDFDESLAEKLKSDFSKSPTWNKIFDLTLLNDKNIPLNKRGSGVRRLVLLSFFQAQAERKKSENEAPSIIYAIEEPETSQHPDHQLIIIDALQRLSKQENVQVLFTTHNANLVREIPIKSLRFISLSENDNIIIEYGKNMVDGVNNEEVIQRIIEALGILPNPSDKVKVLLYVEGNNDVNALKRYSKILHEHEENILNLDNIDSVGYVIAGGSSLKHYIEQKHLAGLGKPEVHIYDNDNAEYRALVRRINDEHNPNKVAFNTTKNELENYLHHEAIIEAYSENGVTGLNLALIEDNHDVPLIVAEKIYGLTKTDWDELSKEIKKDHADAKKKILNTQAVDKMSVDRIRERGGYDVMVNWFSEIKKYV